MTEGMAYAKSPAGEREWPGEGLVLKFRQQDRSCGIIRPHSWPVPAQLWED